MTKRAILAVFCAVLLAGFLAADKATTVDQSKCPVGKIKLTGEAFFNVAASGTTSMLLSAHAWKGTATAPGGVMTLNRERATADGSWYRLSVRAAIPGAGDMVTLTFQPPWTGLPLYTGSLTAPSPLLLVAPANNSHVRVAGAGNLTVKWSGGTRPYIVAIWQGMDGPRVYNCVGILGASVDIPLATFAAGKRYFMTIYDAKRKFAWDRDVDPASDLGLDQRISSFFYAD